jgi:regulator of protease activity HflC (stomatin/prohibitin superfamily)
VDELGLGIKILFAALQEAHPPADVSKSFHDVVSAERERGNLIEMARGQAERVLTEVAGSWDRAMMLDEAIVGMDRLAQDPTVSPQDLRAAEDRVEALLVGDPEQGITPTGGRAAKLIAEAQAESRTDITEQETKLRLFEAELAAFQAAPRLYKIRKYLEMLTRSLTDARKYILVARPETRIIIEYEKEDKGTIEIGEPPE